MKIAVRFANAPTKKESLVVKTEISKEDPKVYKVYSPTHKNHFLLKIFTQTEQGKELYQTEKLVLHLNHPNVTRYIPIVRDESYTLLTHYARYGTFAQVLNGGPLKTETIVRTYFHQLIEGLEYIHSQGFAHLDIKLENLIVGSDFRLKIINFEKSKLISPETLSSLENSQNLQSETLCDIQNKLTAEDICAAGQILFAFRTGKLPFQCIDDDASNPKSYSFFLTKNKEIWQKNSTIFLEILSFSQEFIDLVNGMLCRNPNERLTIQEIKQSSWYKGPVLNMKDLEDMIKPRCNILEKASSRGNTFYLLCLALVKSCG